MKHMKMFGLAIAAAALTAFLGAGTASSTVLCETTVSPCPAGWDVAASTELDFSVQSGTSLIFTDPFGSIIDTCTASTMKGTTTNTGSSTTTVSGHNSVLTFGTAATPCTRPATVVTAGSFEIHHIVGTDNGTVTSTGTTVIVHNVPFFGSCQYSTNATDFGESTHHFNIRRVTVHLTLSLSSENGCPKGTWEGIYEYTGSTFFSVGAS